MGLPQSVSPTHPTDINDYAQMPRFNTPRPSFLARGPSLEHLVLDPRARSDMRRALGRACRSLSTQPIAGGSVGKSSVAGARGMAGSSKITRIQESFFEPVRQH